MIRKYSFIFVFYYQNLIFSFLRSFVPNDYLPYDCLNDGVIIRDHLKKILANFQLDDIINNENEFEKLWSKFDLDNVGIVRTNIFLRLLDYRVNLADEINANIQRLVSHSSAAGMIDGSIASSSSSSLSKRHKQLSRNKSRNSNNDNKQLKHSTPPPTALGEATSDSDIKHVNDDEDDEDDNDNLTRELSIKFRTLVHQHRKMIKQLNETDEFVPFMDRKVIYLSYNSEILFDII